MSRAKKSTTRPPQAAKRTGIVWASFLAAMTGVTGLLALQDVGGAGPGPLAAASIGMLGDRPAEDPVFRIDAALDKERWTGIVIHDSGEPAGEPDSLHRLHISRGLQGLGYHFVIGNGNGLGDGVIHVGYRWNQQLPGAHVPGEAGEHHNRHSIAICLIGNGDRRPFTDAQMAQLVGLVQRLQQRLGIPADRVQLQSDLVPGVSSPGRFFSSALLSEQLLDDRR